MNLALFPTDLAMVNRFADTGIHTFVVDWECRGKHARQVSADTEINDSSIIDLGAVTRLAEERVLCRLNAWDQNASPREIETAIGAGSDLLMLPMVRAVEEVEQYLKCVDSRVATGILVETTCAVTLAPTLARLPVAPVYVGLNDLMIDRGSETLFEPLVDGTIDELAAAFADREFGFGGLTVLELGSPIPCQLLLLELIRTGASMTFLRRSFRADICGRDAEREIMRLHEACAAASRRTTAEVNRDRQALVNAVSGNGHGNILGGGWNSPVPEDVAP